MLLINPHTVTCVLLINPHTVTCVLLINPTHCEIYSIGIFQAFLLLLLPILLTFVINSSMLSFVGICSFVVSTGVRTYLLHV